MLKLNHDFKVCRVCLSPWQLSSLHDLKEETAKFFIEFSSDIAGVDVSRNDIDKHETLFCTRCIGDLEATHALQEEFRNSGAVLSQEEAAREAEETDEGYQPSDELEVIPITKKAGSSNEQLPVPSSIQSKEQTFQCSACSDEFCCETNLNHHFNMIHKKIENFFCDLCPIKTYFKTSLEDHMNRFHMKASAHHQVQEQQVESSEVTQNNSVIDQPESSSKIKIIAFNCTICNETFPLENALIFHLKHEHQVGVTEESNEKLPNTENDLSSSIATAGKKDTVLDGADPFQQEDIINFRMPSTSTSHEPNAMRPSSSRYNFSPGQSAAYGIDPSTSFSFSQKFSNRKDDDVDVVKKSISKRRDVPDPFRRFFDFKRKNRAFDKTSSSKYSNYFSSKPKEEPSVTNLETKIKYDNLLRKLIPRTADKAKYSNYFSSKPKEEPSVTNLETKIKYDNLLRKLIPRTADKAKYSNHSNSKSQFMPFVPVDLSNVETETNAVTDVFSEKQQKCILNRFSSHKRSLKKRAYVDLSSDEDDCEIFDDQEVTSSTLIKSKPLLGKQRKIETSSVIPEIAPMNSLKERQQTFNWQKDAIESFVNRYKERQNKKNSTVQDTNASNLPRETAEQEKQYQRKIDDTLRKIDDTLKSMLQCIILDEKEVIDEKTLKET